MSNFNLRSVRKKANLTQAQLAEKLGINRATVSKYETGEIVPSVDQIINICGVLDVSFEELFGENSGVKPSEIYQSLILDDYIRTLGYSFYDSYPDTDSNTSLCVDENAERLYLIPSGEILSCEKTLHDYAKFQIAELIKKGTEIPDNDGWFKDKKISPGCANIQSIKKS